MDCFEEALAAENHRYGLDQAAAEAYFVAAEALAEA
tara:strand:+ start:505 stop:612 length:108 start_codon:yes stop_codon:yes gene_type:complete